MLALQGSSLQAGEFALLQNEEVLSTFPLGWMEVFSSSHLYLVFDGIPSGLKKLVEHRLALKV